MRRVVGYYTKGGKVRPITSKKPILPLTTQVKNTISHTISSITLQKRMLQERTLQKRMLQERTLQKRILVQKLQKKPWQNGWKKPLWKTEHYSFNIAKKKGITDYYIEVNRDGKNFMSIPLKPLIQRGIGYGLATITGVPIDIVALEGVIQKATSEYGLDRLMQSI